MKRVSERQTNEFKSCFTYKDTEGGPGTSKGETEVIYRVSQKKLYTYTALNFRSLPNSDVDFRNIYGKADLLAF